MLSSAALAAADEFCGHRPEPIVWFPGDVEPAPPLISETRAALTKVTYGSALRFAIAGEPRQSSQTVVDVDLGHEFSILSGCVGRLRYGLWTPIDFHMILSMDAPSAPVLNTDYRFGAMTRIAWVSRVRGDASRERSFGIRFVPAAHESTHIGDEVSIESVTGSADFFRVNVSYEYAELAGTYDESRRPGADGRRGWAFRARAGVTRNWNGRFYDPRALPQECNVPGQGCLRPTTLRNEWFAAVEWRPPTRVWMSTEFRRKIRYSYLEGDEGGAKPTVNILAGYSRGANRPAFFLRYYYGVNPHGQFRNQSGYRQAGVGVHFPLK